MTWQGEIATNEAFADLKSGTFTTGTWLNRILARKIRLKTLLVSATSDGLNSARERNTSASNVGGELEPVVNLT